MRILIAPDSFKGSLSANEVAQTIATGVAEELPQAEISLLPMADGGEGTVAAVVEARAGELTQCEVTGPLGKKRLATYGLIDNGSTAVIEMAEACGLALLTESERDPLQTSTYGCGELILDAIGRGAKRIVMGIGGSATNDGGLGMAQALGAEFYNDADEVLASPFVGAHLAEIVGVNFSKLQEKLASVQITAACDVDNPLLGPQGATAVFGPQKGASAETLLELEAGMSRAYDVIERVLKKNVRGVPGSGAAGGMGAALLGLLDAELTPGAELIAGLVNLETHIAGKHVVITGEGALDYQTTHGKAPAGVAKIAKQHGIPVVAIGGMLDESAHRLFDYGIDAIEGSVAKPCTGGEALADARANLLHAARRVGRWLLLAESLKRTS